ncbi:transglutaminase domain-containing protein [Flavobacterium psychrotrophum]|uniref:transglutaminase domain-containing protein n=1 Tax=Flavobacterium psychrotrophum TaxID=2294119 RepID=UPI000E321D5B|nr:transglutaminase domain-containing protein [Flavobacterium psychrotrophum]
MLILDAILDRELGRLYYDDTFLKAFSKLPESKNLLYPVWYYPFGPGAVNSEGFDDLAYLKMDFIASQEEYKNDIHVLYNKATFDKKRLNNNGYITNIAKLGAIEKWQYCGVFENLNGSGLETEYEAEYYAKNDKTFNANSNGIVNWYNPAITQTEGCHFYYNESEYGAGIMYAQTFINNPADKNVVLNFCSGGDIKILLNDVELYVNDKVNLNDLNAFKLKFNLKKGMNRLVIKSAIGSGNDYFFASLRDDNQNLFTDLEYFDTFKPYNKDTLAEINAVEVAPDFEKYLIEKVKAEPANPLYAILLFDAYNYNRKDELAFDAIEKLSDKYPLSSLLNVKLISHYAHMGDEAKVDELSKNMLLKDEDYYYSLISKFKDGNFLQEANISELERYKHKAENMQSPLYVLLYDYIIALRNSDIDLSFKKIDELLAQSHHNDKFITSFAGLYASIKNDKDKTVSILENLLKTRENTSATNALISYYNSMSRKDDVKKLVNEKIDRYPYFNTSYNDAIILAKNDNRYEDAVKYADTALNNFPYSYMMMEKKGKALNSLKNTKEAEKYFRKSLLHYSGNSSLRKTLYDITKVPDEIEEVAIKDVYSVIKQRRNSKLTGDYGVAMLLDEYIVNILPEGGRKTKVTYVYEITGEKGIEQMKEYNIGSGVNVIKAEIVKPDGSVQPGEQNYGTVVFTNLKVGDVLHIEYDDTENGSGRFYKDFTLDYYFNGLYPTVHTIFGVIYPNDVTFAHNITNGGIDSKTRKLPNNRTYTSWELKNTPTMPLDENYAPKYDDTANKISISSIKSWADISNWYADMVRKNIKMDNIAIKVYNEIFPKGTQGIKEEEIAYKIYKYIEENITYSSLDFRQSGYVPQKPSKTITTKLGDCKDLSTLFVAMAERAGLKANLVLVQTNDLGTEALVLPSVSFNHCIVRVFLNGKEQFLEMTDNYLPFKALPSSLYRAKALVISFDKAENEKSTLISLPFTNALPSTINSLSKITIDDVSKKFENTHIVSGAHKAYYSQAFSDATTADVRKKDFEEDFNSKLSKNVVFEESKLISNERFDPELKYLTKFSVSEKLQSVGSLKIFEIPFVDRVYTKDIIAVEKRNYDINYPGYETINSYKSEVILNIADGKKFTEIPQDHNFTYKKHEYSIKYEQLSPNSLKVVRSVNTAWDNIKTTEYAAFRKFVEDVIATEEEIIGFK